MAAQVVPLFQRLRSHYDWTPRELAQFYRVEAALIQAGLQLETDRGLTDEGDPWFVFCRADNGEVFIHFARIDGCYIAIGAALEQVIQGKDFPSLVQEMLAAQAWAMAKARNPSSPSNVFLHPSALLIALVGAAFFHSSDAKAADVSHAADRAGGQRRFALPVLIQDSDRLAAQPLDANEAATIVSSVLIALNELSPMTQPIIDAMASLGPAFATDAVAPPPESQPLAPSADRPSIQIAVSSADVNATQSVVDLLQPHQTAASDFALAPASGGVGASAIFAATPVIGTAETVSHGDLAAPPVSAGVLLLETLSTDAAQVIQASDVLNYVGSLPSTAPLQAPAVLTEQIKNGEHVLVLKAPDAGGSASSPSSSTSPGGHDPSPAHVAPAETPSAPSGGGDSQPELPANSPIVSAAIVQFATEVGTLDISFSGREVILYDAALLHPVAAGVQIDSVTFNFADGSSISLVGTASELQSLHLPFPVS